MPRAPFVIALVVTLAAMVWLLRLGFAPHPFAADSALTIGVAIVATTLIAVAGLLVVRGRWARNLAYATVGFELILTVAMPIDRWGAAALAVSVAALAALAGPWFAGWLRQRPPATGPGSRPMIVAIGGIALLAVIGVATPSGLAPAHWALATMAPAFAWGYATARVWGLWAMRIALPVAGLAAALASPPLGGVTIAAVTLSLAALAWSREALLAVTPLLDTLPGPRRSAPKAMDADP